METGSIFGNIDVAQIVLYVFWIFFAGLILYLRREDKREGYPLTSNPASNTSARNVRVVGYPDLPSSKQFVRPHDGGVQTAPRDEPDEYALAAEPVAPWPGAPLHPTGNPMKDGVGPAAYANRPDVPDITNLGEPRIVPMRVATNFTIEEKDPDPRGVTVIGSDGQAAGTVTDIWVDRAEPIIRYLELNVDEKQVLLPMPFVTSCKRGQSIRVNSILGEHFTDVPTLSNPDQITLQEEDKICAYYAGGQLYATPERIGPLV
jgi:photosynthetic reaction center H subunit